MNNTFQSNFSQPHHENKQTSLHEPQALLPSPALKLKSMQILNPTGEEEDWPIRKNMKLRSIQAPNPREKKSVGRVSREVSDVERAVKRLVMFATLAETLDYII